MQLLQEDDRRGGIATALAFAAQLVPDLAGAENNTLAARYFAVLDHSLEPAAAQLAQGTGRIRMAQHALGRKDDQRLPPASQGLPPQQVEVLSGSGGLADLNVVLGRELQIALDASARMFRPLSFIAVRQKHDQPGEQSPLVFAGDYE